MYGGAAGLTTSIILYLTMFLAVQHPRSAALHIVFRVVMFLWPGSQMLMAVHSPGPTIFGVTVLALAVLSNGLLYAVVALVGYLVLRRVGVV
jgi:hypothetical protein